MIRSVSPFGLFRIVGVPGLFLSELLRGDPHICERA